MSEDYSYDKKDDDGKPDVSDIEEHVNVVKKLAKKTRELNEHNPHEQAIKFNMVKQNPPDPDFMKVEAYRGRDKQGNDTVCTRSIRLDNGEERWIEVDPMFVFSPYVGFMANIAKAPLHSMDMLLDEAMNMVSEEKKAFKPEKRKDDNQLGWIIFVILCILGSVGAGAFLLFG